MTKALAVCLVVIVAAAAGWLIPRALRDERPRGPIDEATEKDRGPGAGDYRPAKHLGRATDPAITESSGIVASSEHPGVLWTHNDSGDEPRLYCVTRRGSSCGTVTVVGAEAVDWEDIAIGDGDDGSDLYIADIGDNQEVREEVTVYVVPEPAPGDTTAGVSDTFELRYPNGARDAETFIVDPRTGDLVIVTKGSDPVVFSAQRSSGSQTLERVGRLRIGGLLPGPTGGDMSRDGRFIAFSTYEGAYEVRVPAGNLRRALRAEPVRVGLPVVEQREAIAYHPKGRGFYTTSEGSPMPIYFSRRRGS